MIRVTETVPDPLAHPMLNLVVAGPAAHVQKLVTQFGRMAMIKDVLVLSLKGYNNQVGTCSLLELIDTVVPAFKGQLFIGSSVVLIYQVSRVAISKSPKRRTQPLCIMNTHFL